jgi:hypothetical protein
VAERRPKEHDESEAVSPDAVRGHPWRSYKETVARLADRIVEGQKPIRVLQALRWDDAVQAQFLKSKPRELPKVDVSDYERIDLGFDPAAKTAEFEAIARDVTQELGESDPIAQIMVTTALAIWASFFMACSRTSISGGSSRFATGPPPTIGRSTRLRRPSRSRVAWRRSSGTRAYGSKPMTGFSRTPRRGATT